MSQEEQLWLSQGYGLFLRIDGSRLRAFEVTATSCIPAWTATREGEAGETSAWTFRGGFASGDEAFRLVPTSESDVRLVERTEAVNAVVLHRTSSAPASCGRPLADTPLSNFDVLWTTFAENYPFFALHRVDWTALRRRLRPRIDESTGADELFSIFVEMLGPLHDAHVLVEVFPPGTSLSKAWLKEPEKLLWEKRADPAPLEDRDYDRAAAIVESKYVLGRMRHFCRNKVRFGMLPGSIGYLALTSFHGYTEDDDFSRGLDALIEAADAIFAEAAGLKGLVIDIRANSGGNDPYMLEIASRLTNVRYLAFAIEARNDPRDDSRFTTPAKVFVEPVARPFLGPVVLLTGRDTASAGETFAMALMGRKPSIVRIGESTQGVFSDVMDRRLPNGWRFVLPNEVLVTEKGTSYDVTGIPPDLPIPVFAREDLDAGIDRGVEKAIEVVTALGSREAAK